MTQVFGINHFRDGVESQTITNADMSVVGIIGTALGANPAVIPVDTAIECDTADAATRLALGTTGTLPDAIAAISANLKTSGSRIVIVRVAPGANAQETITNMIGSEASGTGMWAFLDAPIDLGITPRLIIAPGFTAQTDTGVNSITVSNGGTGYWSDFIVTATGGGVGASGFSGMARVLNGIIQAIDIINPGKGYTAAPTLVFAAGSGTGAAATATFGNVANQLCVSIPTVLARLKAKFLPEGPTSSFSAWLAWKETLPQDMNIIHPLAQDAKVVINGSTVTKPLSPFIIGLYVRRDQDNGGVPSRSAANQSVNGLAGVSPTIPVDITSDGSLGMQFVQNNAGIVFRGDAGTDGSLSDGGFTFWGTDTLSADTQWMFANVVRMRDFVEINDTKALRVLIGGNNITTQTLQAVLNTLDEKLSSYKANQDILDFRLEFPADLNPVGDLRQGFVTIIMKFEEPPPLRLIRIRSRRYAQALDDLVTNISIQLGTDQVAA